MADGLAEGAMCVCDLTELVGADQSTVLKRRAVLRQAGILEDRKEGATTFCGSKIRCLQGFWGCVASLLAQNCRTKKLLLPCT